MNPNFKNSPTQGEQTPPPKPSPATDGSEPFIYKAIPKTPEQAVTRTAESRVRMTVKSAIQRYLGTFLNADGPRRHLLQEATPFGVQFNTDLTGAADPDDPSIIRVQLARIWSSLREKLPAILIIDSSYQYKRPGAGGMETSRRIANPNDPTNDKVVLFIQKVWAIVGIQLMLAAISESEAGDLSDLVSLILGPLTDRIRGHLIFPQNSQDKWEVRLPWRHESSGLERHNVGDDQRDSMWSTSINLEVEFEGELQTGVHNSVDKDVFKYMDPGFENYNPPSVPFVVHAPTKMSLHDHPFIKVDYQPFWTTLITDSPNIAIVDENNILHPKRYGTFNLILLQQKPGTNQPETIFTQPITISPI